MNIQSISKINKEAVVQLSSDELVKICNVLYNAKNDEKGNLYYKLYGEMMIARDLSQYGHVDDFCLKNIAKCREKLRLLGGNKHE